METHVTTPVLEIGHKIQMFISNLIRSQSISPIS